MIDRLGAAIKRRREARGESLRGLASLVGCNWSSVARWENGERTPGSYYMRRLERVLGFRPGSLAAKVLHPPCTRPTKGHPNEQSLSGGHI